MEPDELPEGAESARLLREIDITDDIAVALFEAAPDAYVIVDQLGTIVLANGRAEALFGYTRDELVGSSVERLVPPGVRDAHVGHRQRFDDAPRPRPMGSGRDLLGIRRDNTEFPVEISLSPLKTPDGTLIMAAVRDITLRIQASRFQRFADEVFAHTEAVIFVKAYDGSEPPGRYLSINRRYAELFGIGQAEIESRTDFDLFPHDLAAEMQDHDREAIAAGESISVRETVPSRGHDRVYLAQKFPLFDEDGDVYAVGGVAADITDLLDGERELRDTEERLHVLEDRQRIARDLHDTVIQRLFALGLSLQGAGARVGDTELAAKLSDAVDELDTTINEIRSAIFELHADSHPPAGIRDDILQVAREQTPPLGFAPSLLVSGPVESIPQSIGDAVIPVIREALSNVNRHAEASEVEVTVDVSASEIVVQIVDDGVGVPAQVALGHGLENMRQRAEALGGSCTLESPGGGGTSVTWRVPHAR
jgi:PAS domain S-box-containing protein